MKMEKIKPVPKYLVERIKKIDAQEFPQPSKVTRFYSYLTKNDGELVKVTVAVRNQRKKWYYKQVAVHGINSERCFVKDMVCFFMGNLAVGWFEEGLQRTKKWYEDPEWGWHYDNKFDPSAPCVNLEYATKLPEFKYSAIEMYPCKDIISYLRRYRDYPQSEYLVKLGLHGLTQSVQILKLLGKDKKFRKWIGRNRETLKSSYYYISSILSAYKNGIDIDEAQEYELNKKSLCSDKDYKPIREMLNHEYSAYLTYLRKQKTSNRLYLDYLKACKELGIDMSLEKNRFPHDFKRWHDIRIDEYKSKKAEIDAKARAELYAKFASVAEKYLPLERDKDGVYIVLIAKTPAELMNEGDTLHHCVGKYGYDQKFVREETLIFFIRSAAEPNVPLVTVEYSLKTHKILQCYGDHNQVPAEDVMTFVNKKWLPYANKKLKKIAA